MARSESTSDDGDLNVRFPNDKQITEFSPEGKLLVNFIVSSGDESEAATAVIQPRQVPDGVDLDIELRMDNDKLRRRLLAQFEPFQKLRRLRLPGVLDDRGKQLLPPTNLQLGFGPSDANYLTLTGRLDSP